MKKSDKSIRKKEMRMLFIDLKNRTIRSIQKKVELILKELKSVIIIHLCIIFMKKSDKSIRKIEMRMLLYRF